MLMNGYNFEYMNLLINYLTSQSSDFECALIWWLFQKRVVRTKFDIYAFIGGFFTKQLLVIVDYGKYILWNHNVAHVRGGQ